MVSLTKNNKTKKQKKKKKRQNENKTISQRKPMVKISK